MESKRRYLGAQWAAQIGEFANDPAIKSLRQEIGIIRMVLDKVLIRCRTDSDLLLRSSTIGDLVSKIERLVTACHTIDSKLGVTLDKSQLVEFGGMVVSLATRFITDAAQLDTFTRQLVAEIKKAGTVENQAETIMARLA